MAVSFLSKIDQTWSNWIIQESKMVTFKKKEKNGIRLQNWVWLGGSFALWLCALTQCILVKPIYSCSLERKKDCKHFVSYKYWIKKNLICRILLLVTPIYYIEVVITIPGHISKLLFELRCLCGFLAYVCLSEKKLFNGCTYQKMLP